MYSKTKCCISPGIDYSNICTHKTSKKPEEKKSFGRFTNILGNKTKHVSLRNRI
jgi:hypothetical protein